MTNLEKYWPEVLQWVKNVWVCLFAALNLCMQTERKLFEIKEKSFSFFTTLQIFKDKKDILILKDLYPYIKLMGLPWPSGHGIRLRIFGSRFRAPAQQALTLGCQTTK